LLLPPSSGRAVMRNGRKTQMGCRSKQGASPASPASPADRTCPSLPVLARPRCVSFAEKDDGGGGGGATTVHNMSGAGAAQQQQRASRHTHNNERAEEATEQPGSQSRQCVHGCVVVLSSTSTLSTLLDGIARLRPLSSTPNRQLLFLLDFPTSFSSFHIHALGSNLPPFFLPFFLFLFIFLSFFLFV